jgi:hypothetical protein
VVAQNENGKLLSFGEWEICLCSTLLIPNCFDKKLSEQEGGRVFLKLSGPSRRYATGVILADGRFTKLWWASLAKKAVFLGAALQ